MTDSPVTTENSAAKEAKRPYGWLSLSIAAIFGLFYAYDVWEAVGNLITVPENYYNKFGLEAHTPWILLILPMVVAMVAYGLVLLLGLKRNVGERALLLLTGIAVSNGLTLAALALNSVILNDLLHRI